MRRFQMMLDDDPDEALDRVAAPEGVSKTGLLRRCARARVSEMAEDRTRIHPGGWQGSQVTMTSTTSSPATSRSESPKL